MDILIKNVSLDGKIVDIGIDQGKIRLIQENIDELAPKVIDGTNKAVLPTFYNLHTHAAMTLLRGYADDLELHTWLNDYIWPFERKLTFEDVYIGTKLACLEMIKTGTTFFCDMYWHPLAAKKAVEEMGLRARLSTVFVDFGSTKKAQEFKERTEDFFSQDHNSELVQFMLGPHAIYTVSKDSLVWLRDFAREHDLFIHIHLAETQKEVQDCLKEHNLTPVKYLDTLGFLGPNVIVAHAVWLDDQEIEILGKRQVKVVHVPTSNLKLASGVCPFYELYKRGVALGLGTDGCASNNNLDIFEELKLSSILAKVHSNDPAVFKAREIFDIATQQSAKHFYLLGGEIKEGYVADLMLIDLDHHLMVPTHKLYSNLVYAGNGSCVDTVICNGKVLMENRIVEGEEEIIAEAKACVANILKR
ncbi:MAG: amidohydrolase [Desulfonauticus sp.]|nr:amidohydrolase [Desulfonauticus sp.]